MNEEEKKAIEYLDRLIKFDKIKLEIEDTPFECERNDFKIKELSEQIEYRTIVKNLIKKLQKENEELVLGNKALSIITEKTLNLYENSISKDKIREKIEQRINTIEKETWYIDNGLEAVNACIEELETLSKELLEEE